MAWGDCRSANSDLRFFGSVTDSEDGSDARLSSGVSLVWPNSEVTGRAPDVGSRGLSGRAGPQRDVLGLGTIRYTLTPALDVLAKSPKLADIRVDFRAKSAYIHRHTLLSAYGGSNGQDVWIREGKYRRSGSDRTAKELQSHRRVRRDLMKFTEHT